VPVVAATEAAAVPAIRQIVQPGAIVHADEAPGWYRLHAFYEMHRINHSIAFSMDGACTNWAESFFSRLRRAEWGQHHHISGKYLLGRIPLGLRDEVILPFFKIITRFSLK
jgi:ISXO2-like transposase domain